MSKKTQAERQLARSILWMEDAEREIDRLTSMQDAGILHHDHLARLKELVEMKEFRGWAWRSSSRRASNLRWSLDQHFGILLGPLDVP